MSGREDATLEGNPFHSNPELIVKGTKDPLLLQLQRANQTSVRTLRVLEAFEKRFESLEQAVQKRLGKLEEGYEAMRLKIANRFDDVQQFCQQRCKQVDTTVENLQSEVLRLRSGHSVIADYAAKISRTSGRASVQFSRFVVHSDADKDSIENLKYAFSEWVNVIIAGKKAVPGVDESAPPAVPIVDQAAASEGNEIVPPEYAEIASDKVNILQKMKDSAIQRIARTSSIITGKKRGSFDEAREIRLETLTQRVAMVRSEKERIWIRLFRLFFSLRNQAGWESAWRKILANVFGITPRDGPKGIIGSRLIDPLSPFNAGFEFLIAALLLYSLFVIPIQLSFWVTSDPCIPNPTLGWDVVVDTIFMFEVFYRFFVGMHTKKGAYCDDLRIIFQMQTTSLDLFWFNAMTSVPVAWLDWYSTEYVCTRGADPVPNNLVVFRILKPLRLIKLFRLLKVSSVYRIIKEGLDFHPHVYRAARIFITMVMALHLFSCLYWRLKYQNDPDELQEFLHDKGIMEESISENYIICMYFVCTIFTTVGFGDIYAMNSAERIWCIMTMLVAACLFGALLGELQEILSSLSQSSREIDDRVEGVSRFLTVNQVPRRVTTKIKAWIRYKYANDQEDQNMQYLLEVLPNELCNKVATTLNKKLFSKILILQKIHDPIDRADFAAALLPRMRTCCYPPMTIVADHHQPADRLMTVMSGRISMCLPKPKHEAAGKRSVLCVFKDGEGIGDVSVLGDTRWAGGYGIDADFIALENSHVAYISTKDILDALATDPNLRRVRQHFEKIAYQRKPEEGEMTDAQIKATYLWINLARLYLALRNTIPESSELLACCGNLSAARQNKKARSRKSQEAAAIEPTAEFGTIQEDGSFLELNQSRDAGDQSRFVSARTTAHYD